MDRQRLIAKALVGAILVPGLAFPGEPANSPSLRPGVRIRVLAPPAVTGVLPGKVVALDETTITVVLDKTEQTISIPHTAITQLDLSEGHKRCTGKGALIGALAGAALMVWYFSGSNDLSQNSGTGDVIGGFAFFLLPPTAVGALVGAGVREERWRAVSPAHTAVSDRRIGVGITIRF